MTAGSRSARQLASSNRMSTPAHPIPYGVLTKPAVLSRDTICISCRHRLAHQTRHYAAAAAAVAEQPAPTQQNPPNPPVTQTEPRKAYRVLASPVLSRAPLLTRELTSFEKAFYLYQKRLNERLALPFTQYFYFKDRTAGVAEWKRKIKVRKTAAKDIGVYTAHGDEAWNDEVLVGDKTSEPESQVEALIRDAEGKDIVESKPMGDALDGEAVTGDAKAGEGVRKDVGLEGTVQRPESRITEADKGNDMTSLSRKLDRSLYLLIKNKAGFWRFPEDRVYGRENVHQVRQLLSLVEGATLMTLSRHRNVS